MDGFCYDVNMTDEKSAEVWRSVGILRYEIGFWGFLTHRKYQLELADGQLTLRRGKKIIFQSPVQEVTVRSTARGYGGLELVAQGKRYVVLFWGPFSVYLTGLRTNADKEWLEALVLAGAKG